MNNNREKGGCGGGVVLFMFFIIIRFWISGEDDTSSTPDYDDNHEEFEMTGPISHSLEWVDTEHPEKKYTGTVTINSSDYYDSKNYKNSFEKGSNFLKYFKEIFVWDVDVSNYSYDDLVRAKRRGLCVGIKDGYMYSQSYYNDKDKLDSLYLFFNKIQKEENLNRTEFADMIVSFVQNIEYSLPWDGDCEEDKDEYLVKSTLEGGKKCYSNISFGWFAPVEFIGNFTGDCDTRTVFLFTVLKHYKYDVVILNSNVYSHSILGINLLPTYTTSPSYKIHNRKKYYTWEATAPCPLGWLSPDQRNISNWTVVLDNNLNSSVRSLDL